ncbi:hypothetical protein IVB45_18485 [Bradyrhizobium sp. 4]|uniref:hypothetical protein n=1 Tax=unclassified Bradyrhizobium TaxID=2631580 RepID=UPI001FF9B5C3|nr:MULTISPECIES: hypothetical protein [unclassified Bradyrhizobium]MCK1400110.1 hypothetical protein [Bradyrhizobium sp. 39]MCK1750400.1 hypothetical protein [Bradyrhizobium sp. 135]UPJ32009.1 hypothetical protein IVB45_18485 [Bradyrhizobium sp. 4]
MAGWADKIRAHSASKQPKPRKRRPIVYSTSAQTRAPNEETGDPGAVMQVHYTAEDNEVKLTDAKGVPLAGKTDSYVLQPGETALRIATRLALAGIERSVYASPDAAWVV